MLIKRHLLLWNLLTCPVFLEEMTQMSAGFSMATIALDASSSFSQVRLKLMMYTPVITRGTHLRYNEVHLITRHLMKSRLIVSRV